MQRSSQWSSEWPGEDCALPAAPETQHQECHQAVNLVTTWLQLQVLQMENGDNFGVALPEKTFQLTTLHTQLEGFHTRISTDSSELGHAAPCVQLATADVQTG